MENIGKMTYFLGMKFMYYENGIILHQLKYELELLKRIDLLNCKVAVTPLETNHKLDFDPEDDYVDATTFRKLIGSLRIMRYIKRTLKYGVLFPFGVKANSELMCYSDSDWCGDKVDKRSTSGYLFKYLGGPISSFSKKQSIVTLSTCEAGYIASVVVACQAVWLLNLL
ncbi:secreted RxLR effector protein 161-like [Lathyrus oleraceus]|uniref:secreted RxLR effector protein 161-like n=1 Tax=Pisum sativum TaxID=3888 RepID=UPI0021CE8D5A|nr:secreted RxLR effector protein 161-like [Pisum sativum]